MITTSDFGKNVRFLYEGEPYVIVDFTVQSPSARGASTLFKVKARNLLNGKLISETFKAGTKFEQPDVRMATVQYLYNEGDDAVFMDSETFDQFNLSLESIGTGAKYLREDLKIKALYFNNQPVNVELPQYVECEVETVEPGTRGNTASGSVTTKATLTNGIEIQVPLNIKNGDHILVSTSDDSFYQRA